MSNSQSTPGTHDFYPLPLLSNPHVQTLLGHLWRVPIWSHPVRRHILRLADGDALYLYDSIPPGWTFGGPIALLVHGLTGSHASPQVQRLGQFLLPHGWRVVRMDQRGARPSLPLARSAYNAGRSADVRARNPSPAEPHRGVRDRRSRWSDSPSEATSS